MPIYKVSCDCPTPLDANPLTVEAQSELEAVAKFKLRNGIVDTDHPITAVNEDPEQAPKKPAKK